MSFNSFSKNHQRVELHSRGQGFVVSMSVRPFGFTGRVMLQASKETIRSDVPQTSAKTF